MTGRPRKKNVYALYRGDELAEALGVKRDTILWLSTPAAHRRANDKWMLVYKIEEDE